MASIHAKFCRHMSAALQDRGIDYGEFCRERGYKDFKLDMDSFTDCESIADAALGMCNGSDGPMDLAIKQAVYSFLND